MKKVIIVLAAALTLTACGGNSEQATSTDSVVTPGPDSSQILPALTDSAKADTVKVLSAH